MMQLDVSTDKRTLRKPFIFHYQTTFTAAKTKQIKSFEK